MKKLKRHRPTLWSDGRASSDTEEFCRSEDVAALEAALAEAVALLREAKQHVSGWTSTGEDIAAFLDKHDGEGA